MDQALNYFSAFFSNEMKAFLLQPPGSRLPPAAGVLLIDQGSSQSFRPLLIFGHINFEAKNCSNLSAEKSFLVEKY